MKQMPLIQKYMTAMPHTIGSDIPINTAQAMMREHQIRHLPVQEGGKLVGVVTDRDVKLASTFTGTKPLIVEDVMKDHPYTASPETPLNTVVTEMAAGKYGCAIIQQGNGKVVGIFTAVDALNVLADTLGAFYKQSLDQPTTNHPHNPRG
jgi:acetoin utilization protein AcuB